jgi:Tol biopolymer transport system component
VQTCADLVAQTLSAESLCASIITLRSRYAPKILILFMLDLMMKLKSLGVIFVAVSMLLVSASAQKKDEKKEKKLEPFKIEKLTQGMGLLALGSLSPDGHMLSLIAKRPDSPPNLYIMNVADTSIRPQLTNLKNGISDPSWSPDASMIAFTGFGETASFSDVYTLNLKTGQVKQYTSNNFSDKEPVFSPDGKRLFYTTDESPLPDAAFGTLHVASVPVAGGKGEAFTEDEVSSILPKLSADSKNLFLVKIAEPSGRHSLWEYDFTGKPLRDITGNKLARIHKYVFSNDGSFFVIWAQEFVEQQDSLYMFDLKNRELKQLPDLDSPMRYPTISPDGKRIAFISPAAEGPEVFLYDIASGQMQQLTNKAARHYTPVFISNDRILFGSDRDREDEIYVINLSVPNEEEKKKK